MSTDRRNAERDHPFTWRPLAITTEDSRRPPPSRYKETPELIGYEYVTRPAGFPALMRWTTACTDSLPNPIHSRRQEVTRRFHLITEFGEVQPKVSPKKENSMPSKSGKTRRDFGALILLKAANQLEDGHTSSDSPVAIIILPSALRTAPGADTFRLAVDDFTLALVTDIQLKKIACVVLLEYDCYDGRYHGEKSPNSHYKGTGCVSQG